MKLHFLSAVLLGAALVPKLAFAQATEGFALNRFDPSERGSRWFVLESLDFRGGAPALGVVGDWAYKPLVTYDAAGNELTAVVRHQLYAHLGLSWVFFERLRLRFNLPVAAYLAGERGDLAGRSFRSSTDPGLGDLRLTADVRLFGKPGDVFVGALGAQLYLPTGERTAFTGDGKVRVQRRLMLAGRRGAFEYATRVGFQYRPQSGALDGAAFGNELSFAAAAGLRAADGRLLVGPELYGSTVVENSDAIFAKRTAPVEAILGVHYDLAENWRIGAGLGPGLTRGLGTPNFRVVASIEFVPSAEKAPPAPAPVVEPQDRDGDGILDRDDACPDEKGVASDDPAKHGCPAPGDRDGDGVVDPDDACVDQAGEKTDDPKTNGCPPSDRDKDGILDRDDACVDEPGVKHEDPKKNGCPAPKDTDGDGILDPDDACPSVAGPRNDDPKKNGCPAARIEKGQIRIIEQVQFATNSDRILPASDPVLQAVLEVLRDHPEIGRVAIEGHTDSRGNPGYDKGLSARRARAVMK